VSGTSLADPLSGGFALEESARPEPIRAAGAGFLLHPKRRSGRERRKGGRGTSLAECSLPARD